MSPATATRTEIEEALKAGHSASRISRELHADRARIRRIRDELGLAPFSAAHTPTLEEKWASHTRPAQDGHLEWIGERNKTSGTPVIRHRTKSYSPAAVAFTIRADRAAEGYVYAGCGLQHCVAPDHVQDDAERRALRAALRGAPEPAACRYGHDRAQHGRYAPDGTAYCGLCNYMAKRPGQDNRPARTPVLARPPRPPRPGAPESPEQAVRALTADLDGGHARWTGRIDRGTPRLPWKGSSLSPLRIAFREHHGREPQGQVTSGCAVAHCVAGRCLQDRPMREAANRLYQSVFGRSA
ncbi:hypothetical protein ACFXKW_26460 [Streptomyces sp. NPDC059193]|uniref:hypothetical protein n=1 Tax=Streptomyces sp. NPDC059193 TaxID=3346763 RepID=UPI0036B6F384